MTHSRRTDDSAAPSLGRPLSARLQGAKPPALRRVMTAGALWALVGLAGSTLVAPAEASATGTSPIAPGSVIVSEGGTIFGGTNAGTGVELNGDVNLYGPNATGNVSPEASFTNGAYGPVTMAISPSNDLWVANENTSDLYELTPGPSTTTNPEPAVTIYAENGALANPFGMAFDRSGDLWVVSNAWGKAYEYTKSELASTAAPTPVATISDFPSTPLSDAIDSAGDLWVSTDTSVVEFSKAELSEANPAPTVTISTSGGAQLVFDSSGNLWLVTGGGPYCFGTPCTNQVLEFTQNELSTSGSPAPAVTISSTKSGPSGSIYGPYSLAFNSAGDLWVENFDNNSTVEFSPSELATSGSPVPIRAIFGSKTGMNFPSYVVVAP